MSLDIVRREVARFLASNTPEVMVIKGHWGVGKTFMWDKTLKEAKIASGIGLKKYSYVSLFGLNSLEAFKFTIFEQQIKTDLIGETPGIESFKTNTSDLAASLGKKSWRFLENIPFAKNFSTAVDAVAFLSLSDTLICIDDFERKGSQLELRDVLGLISALKEKKRCKIALILNDGSFEDEEVLKEYQRYREKVIDIELLFDPSADECTEIALEGDSVITRKLKEDVVLLGINNIRVIKKIERLARLIEPVLAGYNEEVLLQALHTLTLFAWSYYVKREDVPDPEYLKGYGRRPFTSTEEKITKEQKLWNSCLSGYHYGLTDEFDLVIASIVESGFVDEGALTEAAMTLNDRVIAAKSDSSFTKAWSLFHGSFDVNDDEVLNELYNSFMANTRHISPLNLDGVVRLFRELGRDKQADEMIEHYIRVRKDEKKLFNLDDYAFSGDISDDKLVERFRAVNIEISEPMTTKDVLEKISGKNSWGGRDTEVLAATTPDQYYELFKSESGPHLDEWVNTCLKFGRFSNASEEGKKIEQNATEALARIANESPLNARRVAKFGIKIETEVEPAE
ncbi:MAG: hypothetical protein KDI14_07020, partial [Halioglobus sp.]|nr:hypothetical protein [Halioglobus sp.]